MIPLIGLLAGIVLGIVLEPSIPQILQPYLPIAIVAAMDALFGAFRAYLEGTFTDRVFIVSFISNVLIAAAIVVYRATRSVSAHNLRRASWWSSESASSPTPPRSGGHSSMPEDPRTGSVTQEPALRHRHRHARSRNAVSRRVSSLRRSQRRLAAEEHQHPAAASDSHPSDETPVGERLAGQTEQAADATPSTRDRLRTSLLHPGRGQILAAVILLVVGALQASCRSASTPRATPTPRHAART